MSASRIRLFLKIKLEMKFLSAVGNYADSRLRVLDCCRRRGVCCRWFVRDGEPEKNFEYPDPADYLYSEIYSRSVPAIVDDASVTGTTLDGQKEHQHSSISSSCVVGTFHGAVALFCGFISCYYPQNYSDIAPQSYPLSPPYIHTPRKRHTDTKDQQHTLQLSGEDEAPGENPRP